MSEINTVMSAVKNYFYRKTVVWTDNGERLLPIVMHEEFDEQMASFQEQLIAAKERFVKKYPDHVKQARRLGRGATSVHSRDGRPVEGWPCRHPSCRFQGSLPVRACGVSDPCGTATPE